MKLSNERTEVLFFKAVGLIILSVFLYFFIHELSHLLTMLLCNGIFDDLQIGLTSFVAGHIDSQYISIVAISSLLIPLVFSTALLIFKNPYVSVFSLGFTLPSLINACFGLFAVWFIDNSTRATYDIALAFDYAKFPIIIILLTILGILYSAFLIVFNFVRFIKEI